MKKNEIKFKIKINDKTVELEGEVIDGVVCRMNKPISCNCLGNDVESAPNLLYKEGTVYCPACGKEALEVSTFDDLNEEQLKNIHLVYFGTDYITMQKLYKLTYTLPYEKWITVSDFFMKLKPEMVDMGLFEPKFVGWVTSNPEEVEEALNVKPELRIKYREELEQQNQEDKQNELEELTQKVNKVLEEFSVVDTPPLPDGKDKFKLEGEVINNPLNPKNEYGSGEWFVINDDYIWYVRQNAREGDKWEFNNVYVKGSAGGIGKRIDYDDDLAELIRGLKG